MNREGDRILKREVVYRLVECGEPHRNQRWDQKQRPHHCIAEHFRIPRVCVGQSAFQSPKELQ
jgi:hypothetical protein